MGTSLWDQSTTAVSNSAIGGTTISEGCAPANVNDAIRALCAQALGAVLETAASGTDTYTATLAPAPAALTDGMAIYVRFPNANTSTTPSLNINSLGAKTITKFGGAALVAGDIPAGHDAVLVYVLSSTTWKLLNPAPLEGSWTPVLSGTSVAGTFTYTGTGQVGRYIRNGNLVTVWGTVSVSGTSVAPTGSLVITGLPFTSTALSGLQFAAALSTVSGITHATSMNQFLGVIAQNDSKLQLFETGSNQTSTAVPASNWSSAGSIIFTATYRIN